MTPAIELLQRRIERERTARRQAEDILEQKALELYQANNKLISLNEGLEHQVAERTSALFTEQTRLHSLITNLDSGVLLEDEHRRIVLVNTLFCRLFGIPVTPKSLEGADCSQSAEQTKHLFADPEAFVSRIDELLMRREICSEEELHLADGRVFSRTFIPVFSGENYLGHLWKYRDVTTIHQAAESLRYSEEKYRGIIENMELGLMEVDNEGIILRAYPHFCEMVGYTEAELIGKPALDTFVVPEFLDVLNKQSEERSKGRAGVYEIQIYKKSKELIWVLISGAPILDADDKVTGSLGIHYDITYIKNLQRDLEAARLSAELAQEAEKQFLANMSHEIRTPLNAIIGMSHLLYDTQPTNEQREYLDILRNSAEMLRVLISDVLDLSKIRAGHLEVQEKEFDLVGLVRSLVKSAQLRLEERPVRVTSNIDTSIVNLVIGDDLLIHQILSNLIGNAEKFTERGKIGVSLNIVGDKDNRKIEIKVSDTGIGIPPEKLDLVFQTFRQVDGDIKRKFGGTGLGLAITRQIVELQGGTITLESELGVGTIFTVLLPYQDAGKLAFTEEVPEILFNKLQTKGKNFLVVEDNHMNRKYIGALLRKWGMEHTFAHNGREGLELARIKQFDLIMMDIQMPEMDGYEATIAIRQSANLNTSTPIIALTASALLSQKDKAFHAGMNDYLSKPFKPGQLFEKISLYCGNIITEATAEHLTLDNDDLFQFHPRLDVEILNDLYGDDLDYARDMFETFLKNTMPEFERLRLMVQTNNVTELARLTHKLKPTFGMVGLPDIEDLLQIIETAAKAESPDISNIKVMFETLEAEINSAVSAVELDYEKLKSMNL